MGKILIGIFIASVFFAIILWFREQKHLEEKRQLKVAIIEKKRTIVEILQAHLFKKSQRNGEPQKVCKRTTLGEAYKSNRSLKEIISQK